jgi:Cu+-exporting ATPase
VTRLREEKEEIVEIEKLEKADHLILRNEEVIPCDSILASEHASIDYSFVTGESTTIHKSKGDFIYAGGKLRGQRTALIVEKETNRSHLTQLWNETKSSKPERTGFLYQDKLSHYFLIALLLVALVSGIAWFFIDSSRITEIVVAILSLCTCTFSAIYVWKYDAQTWSTGTLSKKYVGYRTIE